MEKPMPENNPNIQIRMARAADVESIAAVLYEYFGFRRGDKLPPDLLNYTRGAHTRRWQFLWSEGTRDEP